MSPSEIRLEGCDFRFITTLVPEHDRTGAINEYSPQQQYTNLSAVPLHRHGHGPFCRFQIEVPKGWSGVYALCVDGAVRYIGESEDLERQFNTGYGHISPAACFVGGQSTNCRINHSVLTVSKAGGCIDLYFYPTSQRKLIKKRLIARYAPPWNA